MNPCDHKFVIDIISANVCRVCGEAEIFLRYRELKVFVEAFKAWNEEACAESDAVVETWEALMDAFERLEGE